MTDPRPRCTCAWNNGYAPAHMVGHHANCPAWVPRPGALGSDPNPGPGRRSAAAREVVEAAKAWRQYHGTESHVWDKHAHRWVTKIDQDEVALAAAVDAYLTAQAPITQEDPMTDTHADAQAAALDEAIEALEAWFAEFLHQEGARDRAYDFATVAAERVAPIIRRQAEAERDELFDAIQGWHVRAADLRARLAAAESSRLVEILASRADEAEGEASQMLDEVQAAHAEAKQCRRLYEQTVAVADAMTAQRDEARTRLADAEVERDEARDDLEVANAHVGALRARMAKLAGAEAECTCQSWPPDGPDAGCAIHGAIRALNEAQAELTALRTRLAGAERDALNRAADELERTKPSIRQFWDVHDWIRVQIVDQHVKLLRERAKAAGAAQAEPGEVR